MADSAVRNLAWEAAASVDYPTISFDLGPTHSRIRVPVWRSEDRQRELPGRLSACRGPLRGGECDVGHEAWRTPPERT